jgi:hypothetical protein
MSEAATIPFQPGRVDEPARRRGTPRLRSQPPDQGCTLLSGMIAPWNLVSVWLVLNSLAANSRDDPRSALVRSASIRSAWNM